MPQSFSNELSWKESVGASLGTLWAYAEYDRDVKRQLIEEVLRLRQIVDSTPQKRARFS